MTSAVGEGAEEDDWFVFVVPPREEDVARQRTVRRRAALIGVLAVAAVLAVVIWFRVTGEHRPASRAMPTQSAAEVLPDTTLRIAESSTASGATTPGMLRGSSDRPQVRIDPWWPSASSDRLFRTV